MPSSPLRRAAKLAPDRWKQLYDRAILSLPDRLYYPLERRAPVELVSSLDDLDKRLAEAEDHFHASEDEGRRFLAGIELVPPPLPADPYSPEYKAAQWALYEHISGRGDYAVGNEESIFDLAEAQRRPFPYSTGSPSVVGDQLIARGLIIRALGLTPPARVIEFGAGWGNLTLDLATMGFDTTVVEVGANFCDLLRYRCADRSNVQVRQDDMLTFEPDGTYDGVVFFESFHHCSDHLAMLERLHTILKPDGVVVFAAEPIRQFPYAWGVRLDGLSLWSIRRFGWLELGFDTDYFAGALERTGWAPHRVRNRRVSPMADLIIARAA